MNSVIRLRYLAVVLLVAWGVCVYQANAAAEDIEIVPGKKRIEVKEDAKEQAVKKIESAAQASDKAAATALPEDTSDRFTIERLQVSGNSLIPTEELLAGIPDVYNISEIPDDKAEPGDLYDMRTIKAVIANPGEPREVSRRTMQGFVQYLLEAYQASGYGGIYIYISTRALQDGRDPSRDRASVLICLSFRLRESASVQDSPGGAGVLARLSLRNDQLAGGHQRPGEGGVVGGDSPLRGSGSPSRNRGRLSPLRRAGGPTPRR